VGASLVHSHVEMTNARTNAQTVAWDYRLYQDPYQRLPGVGPVEGSAVAEVRAGRIVRLTLVDEPASVARQQAALATFLSTQRAGRATPPPVP
jgi:hypothetical protein